MACAVLPGTEKQYQQLRTLIAKQTFVGIVAGPPGTGKKTLVRYVAAETPLQTHDVEVEHVWPPEELRARIARLGTQLTDSSSARHASARLTAQLDAKREVTAVALSSQLYAAAAHLTQ